MKTSRRKFLSTAVAGSMTVAAGISSFGSDREPGKNPVHSRNNKLKRIASNSYAVNQLFKRRTFQQRADYGEKTGVRVTIENHWGLAADPVNIIIILNEVNSPYLESSPDFCNWEHEYMLYHGLEILAPRATSMIHAKRWTRYPDVDIKRCVDVLNKVNYKGFISFEYEGGGDPVEGTLKLMNDVVDALT